MFNGAYVPIVKVMVLLAELDQKTVHIYIIQRLTKYTQHSVKDSRNLGINVNVNKI